MELYCLPDNYEVVDRSLDDIRAVLNPAFTPEVSSDIPKPSTPIPPPAGASSNLV